MEDFTSGEYSYAGTLEVPHLNPHRTSKSGDRHAPDPGSQPTVQDLLFLREFDPVGAFACIGIPEDALGNWLDDLPGGSDEFTRDERREILDAVIDSETLGLSVIVLLDENSNLLEDPELPALNFRHFTILDPLSNFGIEKYTMNADGTYKSFKIRFGRRPTDVLDVAATRCVILRPRHERPVLYPCYDEIWNLREWRRQMGTRSAERLPTRFQFNRKGGTWVAAEKTSVSEAMGETRYMLTSDVEVNPVTGEISDQELVQTLDELRGAIALALRVSVADIRGAEAGQKLSVDSNDTKYARRLLAIQKHYAVPVAVLAEKMGRKFDNFPSPWELRDDLKDKATLALVDAFNECNDEDLKGVLKGILLKRFRKWYNVREPTTLKPVYRPFPIFNGFEDQGGSAERERDRDQTNRERKEQQRFPR